MRHTDSHGLGSSSIWALKSQATCCRHCDRCNCDIRNNRNGFSFDEGNDDHDRDPDIHGNNNPDFDPPQRRRRWPLHLSDRLLHVHRNRRILPLLGNRRRLRLQLHHDAEPPRRPAHAPAVHAASDQHDGTPSQLQHNNLNTPCWTRWRTVVGELPMGGSRNNAGDGLRILH